MRYGIITQHMFKNALRQQSQVGVQIGSVLIELGYVTTDMLLDFFSMQFGVPAVNLFKVDIPSAMLKAMSLAKIRGYKVLPLEIDNNLTLAMVNPNDHIAIRVIEFFLGKRVNTAFVPSLQFDTAIRSIESHGITSCRRRELEKSCKTSMRKG